MKLRGDQIQLIHEALLLAYRDRMVLRQMVRFELNENLDSIADGSNTNDVIFKLVEWAESQGRIEELINAAYNQNAGNTQLQELKSEMRRWGPPGTLSTEKVYISGPNTFGVPINIFLSLIAASMTFVVTYDLLGKIIQEK